MAFSTAFIWAAKSEMTRSANTMPGWIAARSSSQLSRGRIHVTRSGEMPWRSSHRQLSKAVFPAPTMTYWSRKGFLGNSFGGTQSTAGATP